jgi:hypothetical protein
MRGDLAYHVQVLHALINENNDVSNGVSNEVFEVFSIAMELQKFDNLQMFPVKDRTVFRMFANVKSGRIMFRMKGDIVTIALLLARFMKKHNAVVDLWTLFVKSSFINTLHQN